jgi:hypothetical protein
VRAGNGDIIQVSPKQSEARKLERHPAENPVESKGKMYWPQGITLLSVCNRPKGPKMSFSPKYERSGMGIRG